MKICKKCNVEYSDDKKFCKLCGSPLSQDYNIDPKKLAKKSVYEDRLKTDPLNIEILHEYAQFLFNNQLFQNSVSTLLKILAINESDEFAKELLYSSYLKLKMYREAQEIGELLLEDRSTDLSFIEGLAANSLQLGNRDKAYEYYEAILKLDPANPKTLYHKAIGLLEKNEIENAINILNQKYEEGNRDRIVSIYAGIDKYFSDDYDKAIEILTSCFLDNDTTLSDVHSQRGLIYLIYCLCKSKHQIDKIDEWFSLLDFHSIKRFQLSTDSIMLAKATDEVITIYLEPLQNLTSYKIHYSINLYLNKPTIYCTEASSSYIAKIWYKIADIQESMGLLKDAQISFKKATELNPDNTDYIKRLNEIIALGAILEKQQKRKVFTIATSLILLVILIVISVNLYNRHNSFKKLEAITFTDSRDGNVYKFVTFGNQVWMAENLKYLPNVVGPATFSYTAPYYYVSGYNGTDVNAAKATANYSTYGVLYNWPAAMAGSGSSTANPSGVQGVCPTGWHLPSDVEWTQLTDYLGGDNVAGGKLKETGTAHRDSPNRGATNETGFTALPGGYRNDGGTFNLIGTNGFWWSASQNDTNSAWGRNMAYSNSSVYRNYGDEGVGFSVRCVRD